MRTRYINKIALDNKNIPYKWMEGLVSNGKFGGVMLVFIEGFTEKEIKYKTGEIKKLCKTLKEKSYTEGGEENMNDTFRKEYAELTDEQKEMVRSLKDNAQEYLTLLNQCVPQEERSERSRCMAIARTNLETAVMYAVKAVTTKVV